MAVLASRAGRSRSHLAGGAQLGARRRVAQRACTCTSFSSSAAARVVGKWPIWHLCGAKEAHSARRQERGRQPATLQLCETLATCTRSRVNALSQVGVGCQAGMGFHVTDVHVYVCVACVAELRRRAEAGFTGKRGAQERTRGVARPGRRRERARRRGTRRSAAENAPETLTPGSCGARACADVLAPAAPERPAGDRFGLPCVRTSL